MAEATVGLSPGAQVAIAAAIVLGLAGIVLGLVAAFVASNARGEAWETGERVASATQRVTAIENHLSGIDPEPTGRHSDPEPPTWPDRDAVSHLDGS